MNSAMATVDDMVGLARQHKVSRPSSALVMAFLSADIIEWTLYHILLAHKAACAFAQVIDQNK